MPSVPQALTDLVERYSENRDSYLKTSYNETQARREFIDPLFELLGWDVANTQGFAEAYKGVIHEDRVKVGGRTKAPDYSFRIGGTRKFFLEAKRPSSNIERDPLGALQLRRYAWSAKLPLSILTNFEKLAVYDCRVRPNAGDPPGAARIMLLSYDELVARWDEISSIFSLGAIQKGAFDRFASDNKPRKGTRAVDEDFLDEIERWREILARDILRRNSSIDTFDLNDVVQKTIDRIVFLRIAEDRGIEPFGRLQGLSNKKGIYEKLANFFIEADKRYNSGLFHFDPKDGNRETLDTSTLSLSIGDKPLKDIISNLYAPKSSYEFSVIPADILGQVYERFLGKTIRVKSRSIEIDEKPDVKKAGGVYYTPTYIVRYIIKSLIGGLIVKKQPADISGERVGTRPLRIVDPACGSGSFLIEAYQFLLDWHLEQYTKNLPRYSRGEAAKIFQSETGEWRLRIAEKKRILLAHIYGVDVDPQAVEVTKLSLLLKVLEGESSDVVASQIDFLENQRVLPDLGAQIRCGNSIIDSRFYGLFSSDQFTDDELHKINVFDWQAGFAEVFENGGFDVVIGNPPYGATLLPEEKSYIRAQYPWQSYQTDTYLVFMEQCLRRLLRTDGLLGFIIPNPWLTNVRQAPTRKQLLDNARVEEIVHFTFPVFRAKATVDTEIVLLKRSKPTGAKPLALIVAGTTVSGDLDLDSAIRISHDQDRWRADAGRAINIFRSADELALADKIRRNGIELAIYLKTSVGMKPYQVGKGRPKQSRADVTNRVFDATRKIDLTYRQYLRGRDITQFVVAPLEERFIKFGEWLAEPRVSAGFDAPAKILMRQTGDSLVAALDNSKFVCMNNMHVLVPRDSNDDPYFYLGLLNSKVLNWYYQSLNPEMGEALAEVKKTNVDCLPIPAANSTERKNISDLARALEKNLSSIGEASESRRRLLTGLITSDYHSLNAAIYALFSLDPREIAVIEGNQRGLREQC